MIHRKITRILAVAVLLGACTKTKPVTDASVAAEKAPAAPREVNLYIWANYTTPQLLEEFTRKTGIKVNQANYASNEELLAKLQAGATGYDIAVPSDYMVAVMIKLGLLRELDKSKIPNAQGIDPKLLGKPYDPANKYSLPYGWGLTGIAINRSAYTDPVTGWGDLLANDKAKGRVSLLDDVREVMAAGLKFNGFSLNSTKPEEIAKAKATLANAKKNVKAFNSTPSDLLTSGDVVIAHMYSGDALLAARASGKPIEFVLPKEGGTMAIDNAVILSGAKHMEEAYALLNYFYELASDVDLVSRTMSGPVLTGVKERLPKELQGNSTLFPTAETLSRCEMMQDLGGATTDYDKVWAEVKAASH